MNYNEIRDVECGCGRILSNRDWINEMRNVRKINWTNCPMLTCGCMMCVGCGKFKTIFWRESNDEFWDLVYCKDCAPTQDKEE